MKKILLISLVNETSPALRYRITLPMNLLKQDNEVTYDELIFYSQATSKAMDGSNNIVKVMHALKDFIKFIMKFLTINKKYDVVLVKSYAFPVFGEKLEKIIYNKFRRSKILYDIDDAIYMNQTRKNNEAMKKFRDACAKVGFWYKNCDTLLVSNRIIHKDLTEIYNYDHPNVVEFLTCPLGTQYYSSDEEIERDKAQETTNFIWLGSPHTQENLRLMSDFIEQLPKRVREPKVFLIGAHKDFELFRNLEHVKFIDWSPENEKVYMKKSHIGLNPLFDNDFERRKSAFKVIQYYRAGIFPIVSDTGINRELTEKYGGYCTDNFDSEELYLCINNVMSDKYIGNKLYNESKELTLESNKEKINNAIQKP